MWPSLAITTGIYYVYIGCMIELNHMWSCMHKTYNAWLHVHYSTRSIYLSYIGFYNCSSDVSHSIHSYHIFTRCQLIHIRAFLFIHHLCRVEYLSYVARCSFWGKISMFANYLDLVYKSRFPWILCKRSRLLVTWLFGIHGNITYLLWCHLVAQTTSPTHCLIAMRVYCDVMGQWYGTF